MNHIRDKKRWWVANFCSPTVAPVTLPVMSGLAFGLALVGLMFVLMAIVAAVPESHALSLAIVVPVVAGQRNSITMKQLRTDIATKAEGILNKAGTEKRELTAEEKTTYDADVKDIKDLNVMIADAEVAEAALAGAPTLDPQARRPAPQLDPSVGPTLSTAGMPSEAEIVQVYGAPRKFKGPNAAQRAYAAGMWIMAAIFGREDAREWCQNNGQALVLVDKNFKQVRNVSQEKTNTGGGFLVPTVLESMIIDLREQYGLFRRLAKVVPMASDAAQIPRRKGGLTAYPVGESATGTQSTKTWSQVQLIARKWMVLTKYTSELAEDAVISIAEDLAGEVAYAFAFAEDDAGFNGDGSSSYHGITGVKIKFDNQVSAGSSTYAGALDAASGHDTFAEIDNTDLTNLMAKLPKYAEANAKWYISQAGNSATFNRLKAGAGGNTITTLTGKPTPEYLGYPIEITQSMPTSTGDLSDKCMVLFGDMAAAVAMGSRRGMALAVSDQIYFETDEIGIRGTERFDINVHDIGDTSTAGPLVALIGE